MNKKFLSLALCGVISSGGIASAINITNVYAAEVPKKIEQTESNATLESTLEYIQNNYLRQNSDGTFYISDNAYTEVSAELIDFIKPKMDEINNLILDNKLKFKMIKFGNTINVINTKNNMPNKTTSTRSSANIGSIISNPRYYKTYTYKWWGYHGIINAKGAALLHSEYTSEAAIYGTTTALLAAIPGGAAAALAAGLPTSISYITVINACNKGSISGKGVNITGLGAPKAGQVIGVSAII